MIKFIRNIKHGTFRFVLDSIHCLNEHIDHYYTMKDNSIMDLATGDRAYVINTYVLDERIRLHLSLTPNNLVTPRVDCIAGYTEGSSETNKHMIMIIPERWYRNISWFEKFALLHYLNVECSFINVDECMYEERRDIIEDICKIFPNFIAPKVNKLIDDRIDLYRSWKEDYNGVPPLYLMKINFTNVRGIRK